MHLHTVPYSKSGIRYYTQTIRNAPCRYRGTHQILCHIILQQWLNNRTSTWMYCGERQPLSKIEVSSMQDMQLYERAYSPLWHRMIGGPLWSMLFHSLHHSRAKFYCYMRRWRALRLVHVYVRHYYGLWEALGNNFQWWLLILDT